MSRTTDTTYDATYDDALAAAEALYDARESRDGYPEGEYEPVRDTRLNNAWVEGLTIAEWVTRALTAGTPY